MERVFHVYQTTREWVIHVTPEDGDTDETLYSFALNCIQPTSDREPDTMKLKRAHEKCEVFPLQQLIVVEPDVEPDTDEDAKEEKE